jgi:hypothetical protein
MTKYLIPASLLLILGTAVGCATHGGMNHDTMMEKGTMTEQSAMMEKGETMDKGGM